MLALKTASELKWGELQYIENPNTAKNTIERNHNKKIGGDPIINAKLYNLPKAISSKVSPYDEIHRKLENGSVFLVNMGTINPVLKNLKISDQKTTQCDIVHGQSETFKNAADAMLKLVPVPQVSGVVRQEPTKGKAEKQEENKKEREKHVVLLDIDGDENKPLPNKHTLTLYIENTTKSVRASRKILDVVKDQFSSVFLLDPGEKISVYAIADHMHEVREDLKKNKNIKESDAKGLIKPLTEDSQETRQHDGALIHKFKYQIQKMEVVDVIHVTGKNELIVLNEAQSKELEQAEKEVQEAMKPLRDALLAAPQALSDSDQKAEDSEGQVTSEVQKAKDQSLENAKELELFDKSISKPTELTEIKRLGGQKRTWVRSDKVKNHWRRYKMGSQDRERNKGWYEDKKVDGKKLKEAIASELEVKFKTDIFKYESDKNNILNQLHTEYSASLKESNPNLKDKVGFDASRSAQFMRFASMAGAAAEVNLSKGKVAIQAQAEASFDLAKGELKAEQVFPVNSRSKIIVPYDVKIDGKVEKREVDLGHLQGKLETTLSGAAGASVLLAANVEVDCSSGVPALKGKHVGADGKAKAFAGIRAGCELKGTLSWMDVLSQQAKWKQLCLIGKKVEGAAGIGAEGSFTFGYNDKAGKFLLRVHAGLVIGVGAAGEFMLEVDPKATLTMVHFMYDALREVDYRRIELFDEEGFKGYQNLCLYMIAHNIDQWENVIEQGVDLVEAVKQYIEDIEQDFAKEEDAFNIANNIITSSEQAENSVLLHSPPEVKGILLELLMFDPSGIWDNFSSDDDVKRLAMIAILKSIQGQREYYEVMARIDKNGDASNQLIKKNARRLFEALNLGVDQQEKFEKRIFSKVAPVKAPVQLDPTGACKACGIA